MIVYDDKLEKKTAHTAVKDNSTPDARKDPNMFLARILQYLVGYLN